MLSNRASNGESDVRSEEWPTNQIQQLNNFINPARRRATQACDCTAEHRSEHPSSWSSGRYLHDSSHRQGNGWPILPDRHVRSSRRRAASSPSRIQYLSPALFVCSTSKCKHDSGNSHQRWERVLPLLLSCPRKRVTPEIKRDLLQAECGRPEQSIKLAAFVFLVLHDEGVLLTEIRFSKFRSR
jgi:hypothetical protein